MGRLLIATLVLALGATSNTASATSAKCEQARSMVSEIEHQLADGPPDKPVLEALLLRLETARNLCPELGAAWKHSYCIATALGEGGRATSAIGLSSTGSTT